MTAPSASYAGASDTSRCPAVGTSEAESSLRRWDARSDTGLDFPCAEGRAPARSARTTHRRSDAGDADTVEGPRPAGTLPADTRPRMKASRAAAETETETETARKKQTSTRPATSPTGRRTVPPRTASSRARSTNERRPAAAASGDGPQRAPTRARRCSRSEPSGRRRAHDGTRPRSHRARSRLAGEATDARSGRSPP